MGQKINVRNTSGLGVYGVIFDSEGLVYDVTTGSMTDYVAADFNDYALPFVEKGDPISTAFFEVDFPSNLTVGKYTMCTYAFNTCVYIQY
jgi:hypothetical protein